MDDEAPRERLGLMPDIRRRDLTEDEAKRLLWIVAGGRGEARPTKRRWVGVNDDTRRNYLGLGSDIDRKQLAFRILMGRALEDAERVFVARLVDPKFVKEYFGPDNSKGRGRKPTTTAALKLDRIVETYCLERAWKIASFERPYHKQLRAHAAELCRVSESYVEKALGKVSPTRRKEIESVAREFVDGYYAHVSAPGAPRN